MITKILINHGKLKSNDKIIEALRVYVWPEAKAYN